MSEQVKGENNFLADLAGIQFECSIAAAHLNKRARDILQLPDTIYQENEAIQELYTVGLGTEQYAHAPMYTSKTDYYYNYDDDHLPVILTMPLERIEETTPVTRSRFRRNSAKPQEPTLPSRFRPNGDPILAVQLDDIALPIATFANRFDEQCSYVQLGSDMHDDALFVTKLDEATPRNDIVEALRKLRRGSNYRDPEELPVVCRGLVNAEFERATDSGELQRALYQQLNKDARSRFERQASVEAQFIESTAGGVITRNVAHQPLTPAYTLDGVTSWLTLAKEQDGPSDTLQIGSVSRGAVYSPLLGLEADGSHVDYNGAGLTPQTLRQMIRLTRGREINDTDKVKPLDVDSGYSSSQYRVPTDADATSFYAETIGLALHSRNRIACQDVIEEASAVAFVRKLDGVEPYQVRGRGSQDVKIFAKHTEKLRKTYKPLFVALGATAINEALRTRHEHEVFLTLLGHLAANASGVLYGKITNLKVGKTVGGLDFAAEVTREDSFVRLNVSSRPSAMPQENYRHLYTGLFDLLGTVDLEKARVEDLTRVLRVVAQQET